ncbi:MAG: DUF2145 domain-containing protein [Rhizobacter sp.]|nr:DUF2145 domain-containing protein [Rhizobacter sp.]
MTAIANAALLLGLGVSAWGPWNACQAAALRFCDRPAALSAGQQDTLFRFGAIVKEALDVSGQGVALIARSGLDLSRFGMRYSHAGFSLRASPNSPWSVRQLYYACDEQKPRIYDQGLAGFLLGSDAPDIGYLSVVFLPAEAAIELERAALDDRQALQLLGVAYSANAYPFSLRYQNCNQWVIELLAAAWGQLGNAAPPRAGAQGWPAEQGYVPSVVDVGYRPLMWAGAFIPLLNNDDHPAEDLARNTYRVSMPASIEAFVQAHVPGATRIEFCHNGRQVVVRQGWGLIPEGCRPEAQDSAIALD